MFFRKVVTLGVVLVCFAVSLFSEDKTTGFSYCSNSLQQVESHYLHSQKNTNDQLYFVRNVHNILLDFLHTADEEEFYAHLQLLKPSIDMLEEVSNNLFFQIYPNRHYDRKPFTLDGSASYLYYNIFSQKHALTDEERTTAYEEEEDRHKGIRLLPKQLLTQESRRTLISGQPYNFILNKDNEAYVSYEQRYRLKEANGKTVLNSPNHTLLAGNNPVLSAGVLRSYKIGRKELYVISCSSGHFHPTPDSLFHMKKYLARLGVPEEAIIVLNLTYDQIVSEMHKIKYAHSETNTVPN